MLKTVRHAMIMNVRTVHVVVWMIRKMHVLKEMFDKTSYGKALEENAFKAREYKGNISTSNA
jgi:hypothetical protein